MMECEKRSMDLLTAEEPMVLYRRRAFERAKPEQLLTGRARLCLLRGLASARRAGYLTR